MVVAEKSQNTANGQFSGCHECRSALAISDGDAVIWFWIGSHSDHDKILK